jgi:L-asparaginase II
MRTTYDLDVVVTRGDLVESRHHVHAAVVDASGAVVASARDPHLVTMWRSCAKPFQLLPLLASGGFDRLGWGPAELTLACASHGGEPEHVALADRMLGTLGLEQGDLACGPHEPLSPRGRKLLRDQGDPRPTRLHNNCSGKHAAMLARARDAGWPTAGYERLGHPVQEGCLAEVATWTGVPRERIALGVDGCGVVVMGLPLTAMALAYARLGAAAQAGDELPARIVAAVRAHPHLLGGADRFDTVLLEATGGRALAKVGAEGVHTVMVPTLGVGFAVKAEDGAQRAQHAAVVRLLQHLGVVGEPPPALAPFLRAGIKNTRGEVVGEVRPAA